MKKRGCTVYGLYSFMVIFIETYFMLSMFGKKEIKPKITDRVFISSAAKQNAILAKVHDQSGLIIITWFEESYNRIEEALQSNSLTTEIYMAREIAAHNIQNRNILFFEHYPSLTKENELLQKLQLDEAIFYSSLDEPLFLHFGGEKMISLIQQMGISENEAIEHPMVSTAIKNAQEKISKEVGIEYSAVSQADWFSKNIVK